MRQHVTPDGTVVDLDHLLTVGPVHDDWSYTIPWMFTLTMAWNTNKLLCYNDQNTAIEARNALLSAWASGS